MCEDMKILCSFSPRVAGSPNEQQTAEYVAKSFNDMSGLTVTKLQEDLPYFDAKLAVLEVSDADLRIEGIPCWMSRSTPPDGLVADCVYVGGFQNITNLDSDNIQGNIVAVIMAQQYHPDVIEAWKKLFAMNPAGVIFLDRERDNAPRTYMYEPLNDIFSSIPCMVILAKEVHHHESIFGKEVRMFIEGNPTEGKMHIVTAEKSGKVSETIVICAHHDSLYLTEGATDNAAGVAIMLEVARFISKMDTHYTYRFISFGAEEMEMKGSRWYVEREDISDVVLCMNFDSIGALPGIAFLITGADESFIGSVSKITEQHYYPSECRTAATSGGDNIVFAAQGIPTIHFAFFGSTSNKVSHSYADKLSLLNGKELVIMSDLACRLIEDIENSQELTEVTIPDDMIESAKNRIGID